MPRMRTLSGTEVIEILGEFGFRPVSQRGSQLKLRRVVEDGSTQTLTIPNHKEIDRGTLQAIFRQAAGSFLNLNYVAFCLRSEHQCRQSHR